MKSIAPFRTFFSKIFASSKFSRRRKKSSNRSGPRSVRDRSETADRTGPDRTGFRYRSDGPDEHRCFVTASTPTSTLCTMSKNFTNDERSSARTLERSSARALERSSARALERSSARALVVCEVFGHCAKCRCRRRRRDKTSMFVRSVGSVTKSGPVRSGPVRGLGSVSH